MEAGGWDLARAIVPVRRTHGPQLLMRMLGDGAVDPGSSDMDGALWSRLPGEMLTTILLLLPRISQLRFQAVCKKWRSLLRSGCENRSGALLCAFRLHIDGGPSSRQREPNAAPGTARRKLHKLDVSRSIPHFWDGLNSLDKRPDADRIRVVAQEGLLAIQESAVVSFEGPFEQEFRNLFFINPMSNTWRRLIKSGVLLSDCVELGKAKTDIGMDGKLFYACSTTQDSWFRNWITGFYSPDTLSWSQPWRSSGVSWNQHGGAARRPHAEQPGHAWSDPFNERAVISNGVLYSYQANPDNQMSLLVHNIEACTSESFCIQVPGPCRHPRFFLVKSRAAVFFVGLSSSSASPRPGFQICKLIHPAKWEPVASMPETLLQQLERLGFLCNDEQRNMEMFDACITAGDCIFLLFRNPAELRIVCHDLATKSWHFAFESEGDLATFHGFFEARPEVPLYKPGYKGRDELFTWEDPAGYLMS